MKFVDIEAPHGIDEHEARWLHSQLLLGTPSGEATQAALKIERGWVKGLDVLLSASEKREVVGVLDRTTRPGEIITGRLRWLQQNLRESLREDVA